MKRLLLLGLLAVLAAGAFFSIASAGSRSSAWLGVYTQEVDRRVAEAFDLKVKRGAFINEVVEDSPAAQAGLQEDDVIVAFDGERVTDDLDLLDFVEDARPGDKAKLTIMRGADEKEFTVTLERRPRSQERHRRQYGSHRVLRMPAMPDLPDLSEIQRLYGLSHGQGDYFIFGDDHVFIGVSLLDISEALADHFGADGRGVLINDIHEDSPAEKAELKTGDIIIALDGDKVFDAQDVQEVIRDLDDGDIVEVEVIRDKKALTIKVEVAESDDSYGSRRSSRSPFRVWSGHNGSSHSYSRRFIDLDLDDFFDVEEFEADMEELEEELKDLEIDLEDLRESRD